jgi:hypothetical protein
MSDLTTLYRPVGQPEFDLIAASSFRAFPPRLPSQPIFYPVTNLDYAIQIAREWNTKDVENGSVGYVLRFQIPSDYAARYPIRQVGDHTHSELWVPAEDLPDFNAQIIGFIEVIHEFRAATSTI